MFGGDVNGYLRVFDDESDDVLWEVNVGSAVTGFRGSHAVNGRQYVAVGHRRRGHRVGVHMPDPGDQAEPGNNLFVFGVFVFGVP